MSFSFKFSSFAFLCGVASLTLYPVAAQAGFDWTPPPVPVPVTQNAEPVNGPLTPEPDAPVPMVAPAAQAPVSAVTSAPLQEEATPSAGLKFLPAKEVAKDAEPVPLSEPVATPVPAPAPTPVVEPVVAPAPEPVATPVAAAASVTPAAETEKTVEGFGKDIPLALALRDIVPSDYAYVFEAGEMAGRRISWRGGKSWQQVLDAALVPAGLKASVNGKVIMVSGLTSVAVPVAAPVSPSASPITAPVAESSPAVPVAAPEAVAPAPKKADMPVVDLTVKRQWNVRPGTTLRGALEQWSKDADVVLNWSTAYDYPIANAFYFEGTFGEAVDAILSSYGSEHPAPKGRLYPNLPDGPSVLMIN